MTLGILLFFSLSIYCMAEPTWTTLRVTWGKNIFNPHVFAKMPLTVSETHGKGFKKISRSCVDGKFYGYRYMKEYDPSVILIYDSKDFIAGIQMGIPSILIDYTNITNFYSPAFQLGEIDNKKYYFLTAYFMNPVKICNSHRTKEEFNQNIGIKLWLQTGPTPAIDLLNAPLYEKNITGDAWTKGKCWFTMGQHYWYGVYEDMNCEDFFPFFLMYNRGKLTGFGFALIGDIDYSRRFEYPSIKSLSRYFQKVPKCINEVYQQDGIFNTLRVFFTVRPWNIFC